MVRITLPFAVGAVLAHLVRPSALALLLPLAIYSLFTLWSLLSPMDHRRHRWKGPVLVLWFLLFGAAWQVLRDPRNAPGHVDHLTDLSGPWALRVVAINGTSARTIRLDAEVEGQWRDSVLVERHGRVMLVLMAPQGDAAIRPGDRLLVDADLAPVHRVPDPGGFDRERWASSRGITLEAFVPEDQWRVAGHHPHWTAPFDGAREAVSEWIDGSELAGRERALVKALVLGLRDELEPDQRQAFARSGTIHVLAVSGMHVGLIFAMLSLMLGWWGGGKRARLARGILVLLALWCYAGLTGGSPSVLRATIMFSLFTVANMSAQRTDHLNSLFTAAFLLLMWDPDMVWRISFQLSFLAVLGIIMFYKPLERLWMPRHKLLRGIWSLAVVSISAQLLTTPVSLHLFQAFPVWFLPANLVVVTAVGLAVNGSVLLLLLYKVPGIGAIITWAVGQLLWGVGWFTEFVASLPWAYPAVRIGPWDVLWLYIMVLSGTAWWQWGGRRMRMVFYAAAVPVLIGWGQRAAATSMGSAFVVYDDMSALQAAMVQGREWTFLRGDTSLASLERSKRRLEAHARARGLMAPYLLDMDGLRAEQPGSNSICGWGGGAWSSARFRVVFHEGSVPWPGSMATDKWDALVLYNMDRADRKELVGMAQAAHTIVVGPGVHWRVRRALEELASAGEAQVHDIRSRGAFVLEGPS